MRRRRQRRRGENNRDGPLTADGVQQERAPNGDHYVWLDPRFVDRLRAMRGPGESYSDVILRVASS
jgi:hypothetical protein